MTQVIAVIFDGIDDAQNARKSLRELEKVGRLDLDDAAVIYKDEKGKIHHKGETDAPVVSGALIGGLVGVMVFFLFPIAGITLGALGGAAVGKSLGRGIDKNFVKQTSEALTPGKSALIMFARDDDPAAIVAAFRPYKGTVFQTSVSPELEEQLKSVLKD